MTSLKLFLSLIFLLSSLVGCVSVVTPTISGDWSLQLNSGEKFPVTIDQIDLSNIFIKAEKIQISGRYSLKNNLLTLQEASQPRIINIEFISKNHDSWVMVKSPPTARVGYQLSGSSLTRIQK